MSWYDKHITRIATAAAAVAFGVCGASAQVVKTGTIDGALESGIDFRVSAFADCLDVAVCKVGALTIFAERQSADGTWMAESIYWDPIDGFGVMGGRQNDEIDADERLTIQIAGGKDIAGIWLSDLFIGEGQRYDGEAYSSDDVETASIAFSLGKREVASVDVHGVFELPKDPFASTFTDTFAPGGDLLNRFIVNDGKISIVTPDTNTNLPVSLDLGRIDPAKSAVFSENATAQADIATLLGKAENVPVFAAGTSNAERILSIRDDLAQLEKLRSLAELQRRIGNAENGELGWYADKATRADRIVLTAGLETSNDYSVAGIVISGPFDNGVYMAQLGK